MKFPNPPAMRSGEREAEQNGTRPGGRQKSSIPRWEVGWLGGENASTVSLLVGAKGVGLQGKVVRPASPDTSEA